MAERNSTVTEDRRIEFRIGIMATSSFDEGDVYGDGVNIARFETLANPGSTCIAASAYRQIEGKVPAAMQLLSQQPSPPHLRPPGLRTASYQSVPVF